MSDSTEKACLRKRKHGTQPLPNSLVKTHQAGTEAIRVGTDTRASSGAVYILHPTDGEEQQKQPIMQRHRLLGALSLGWSHRAFMSGSGIYTTASSRRGGHGTSLALLAFSPLPASDNRQGGPATTEDHSQIVRSASRRSFVLDTPRPRRRSRLPHLRCQRTGRASDCRPPLDGFLLRGCAKNRFTVAWAWGPQRKIPR